MHDPATAEQLDEPPMPPPWRGVRRLAVIIAVALMLATIVWFIWSGVASRRYRLAVAAERAKGEPVFFADLTAPPVAVADNAATYWTRAAAAVNPNSNSPTNSNFTFPDAPPFPQQWFDLENAAYVAGAPALDLAMRASAHRQLDWGRPPTGVAFFNRALGSLNLYRTLANEMGDAAMLAHFNRDDAEALARVTALLDLSDDIARRDPGVICYLVAVGIRALDAYRLEMIAADLRFIDESPNGATVEAVRRLIDRLSDPALNPAMVTHVLLSERAFMIDTLQRAATVQPVLRPMIDLWIVTLLRLTDQRIVAAQAMNQPTAQTLFDRTVSPPGAPRNMAAAYLDGIQYRFLETGWRVTAEQRLIAVQLALQLYQHDHHAWPKSLAALVPSYFSVLPADPYSRTGRPIGYALPKSPDGRIDRPVLYVDPSAPAAGGAPPVTPAYGWQGSGLGISPRQWRDVDAWQIPAGERHRRLSSTTRP